MVGQDPDDLPRETTFTIRRRTPRARMQPLFALWTEASCTRAPGDAAAGLGLTEADYRGTRFPRLARDCAVAMISVPDASGRRARSAHAIPGGGLADLIETNTFTSNYPSLADYGLEGLAYEINREERGWSAKRLTKEREKRRSTRASSQARCGPTTAPRPSPPSRSSGTSQRPFADLEAPTTTAPRSCDGGADILFVETIFDTLNAKAAIFAIERCFETSGVRLPVVISGTITDASGRTLSGQTGRGLLELDPACASLRSGLELRHRLRASCVRMSKSCRGSKTCRSSLPERRAAEELGGLRRNTEKMSGSSPNGDLGF